MREALSKLETLKRRYEKFVGYPARSVVHRPVWERRVVDSRTWLEAGFRNAWPVARTTHGLCLTETSRMLCTLLQRFGETTGPALILIAR